MSIRYKREEKDEVSGRLDSTKKMKHGPKQTEIDGVQRKAAGS